MGWQRSPGRSRKEALTPPALCASGFMYVGRRTLHPGVQISASGFSVLSVAPILGSVWRHRVATLLFPFIYSKLEKTPLLWQYSVPIPGQALLLRVLTWTPHCIWVIARVVHALAGQFGLCSEPPVGVTSSSLSLLLLLLLLCCCCTCSLSSEEKATSSCLTSTITALCNHSG